MDNSRDTQKRDNVTDEVYIYSEAIKTVRQYVELSKTKLDPQQLPQAFTPIGKEITSTDLKNALDVIKTFAPIVDKQKLDNLI